MDTELPSTAPTKRHPAAKILDYAGPLLAVGLLGFFLVYYWLFVFKVNWYADAVRLVAGIRSLYADFYHPRHETLPLPGTQSVIYTPYVVAVAVLGRLFHQDPFAALQYAGAVNLVLFTLAVCFFFRTFSLQPQSLGPAVLFLFVTLFLRTRSYGWASETSVIMIGIIHNYPSMVGWIAALFCFAAGERYFRGGRGTWRWLALIGITLWFVMLTHNLSGSWIFGILGVQGLIVLHIGHAAAPLRRSVVTLYAVMFGALILTGVWPYFSLLRNLGLVHVREGSYFAKRQLRDFYRLYLLFAVALIWLWRIRRHHFYVGGFVATLSALLVFRLLGIDYGNRYAFFQLFFAQAAVADVACFGLLVTLGLARGELGQQAMASRRTRIGLGLYFLLVMVLTATAPIIWTDRHIPSVSELWATQSAHDDFYAREKKIASHIGAQDVVMIDPFESWYIAALTGACTVVSRFAFEATDFAQRQDDGVRFFSVEASDSDRLAILNRYGVTWVIISDRRPDLFKPMLGLCGPPAAYTLDMILFKVR